MQNGQHQLNAQTAADIELVRSAKEGDIGAFEELVRRHKKRVFAIACHITRSHEDAEEVSQETFLKTYCHLKDFEEKARSSTWLTRIAVNKALTKARRSNLIAISRDDEPPLYNPVLLLRDVQGLSVTETAAALRLSIPTVKTRLRARLQLRESLSKSFIPTWTEAEHARSNLVARARPPSAPPVWHEQAVQQALKAKTS